MSYRRVKAQMMQAGLKEKRNPSRRMWLMRWAWEAARPEEPVSPLQLVLHQLCFL